MGKYVIPRYWVGRILWRGRTHAPPAPTDIERDGQARYPIAINAVILLEESSRKGCSSRSETGAGIESEMDSQELPTFPIERTERSIKRFQPYTRVHHELLICVRIASSS